MAGAGVVAYLRERGVAKRWDSEPGRGRLAGGAAFGVRAPDERARQPAVHDDDPEGAGERDGLDRQGAAVDQERVTGRAVQGHQLVHEPAGHSGGADLGVERGPRQLGPVEPAAPGIGEPECERDRQGRARRQSRAERDGRADRQAQGREVGAPLGQRRDRSGHEAAPCRFDGRGRVGAVGRDVHRAVDVE